MGQEIFDFDTPVDRRNTDSLKYDFAERRGKPADVLPLWVADMDFRTSESILEAIRERTEHGIFGYTETGERYFDAVAGWMRERHGWTVQSDWLVKTPGVVFALAMAVKAYTEPGDAVLIQQPVYYPFSEVIAENGRRVVSSDLRLEDGKYRIDFDDLEQKIAREKIKLFFLCSPHNPVGRVWTREELTRVGDICLEHGVTVVCDEIHEDFVFGDHRHIVFAGLKPEFAEISVTCTSPGKTFNLAGLQVSNIFIPNAELRERLTHQIAAVGYSQLNTLGLTACEAAYRNGGAWYEAMLNYVGENLRWLRGYLETELPELRMTETEGTYLAWVDFRGLGLEEPALEDFITHRAKLWLDRGVIFGQTGAGFERINAACPRVTLERAAEQLKKAIKTL